MKCKDLSLYPGVLAARMIYMTRQLPALQALSKFYVQNLNDIIVT
jgi:hypothetical protein